MGSNPILLNTFCLVAIRVSRKPRLDKIESLSNEFFRIGSFFLIGLLRWCGSVFLRISVENFKNLINFEVKKHNRKQEKIISKLRYEENQLIKKKRN